MSLIKGFFKKDGVTQETPENIMLGAGTIYKNLKYETSTGWTGTILAATSGGNKYSITNELQDLEVDGVHVKTKKLTVKQGETAKLEVSCVEITEEIAKQVEIMIIVGDKKSSNTNKLYNISCEYCKKVIFAKNADEINKKDFVGVQKVGIMAGASTPKEDIDEVERNVIKW